MTQRYVVAVGVAVALLALLVLWPSGARNIQPLLVADLRGHALFIVDPVQPQDARRIALPGGPHELLRLPDGRVVVSLEQSGLLAVVDLDDGNVETIDTGGLPHGLALDGGTLLVTDRSTNVVRRLALTGWQEIESWPAEAWPHAVGVLADGSVTVASAEPGTLTIGGTAYATGAVTETLAVSPDGTRVATASAHDGTVEIFAADGELIERYEVGGRPVRVMFSPDGQTVAVALSAGHAVALLRADEGRRIAVSGVPDGLAFSSDGMWLYASDMYGGNVTAIDLGRHEVAAVIEVGETTGALLALQR